VDQWKRQFVVSNDKHFSRATSFLNCEESHFPCLIVNLTDQSIVMTNYPELEGASIIMKSKQQVNISKSISFILNFLMNALDKLGIC
jgi:hypothetical protein